MCANLQQDIEYASSVLNGECKDKFKKLYTHTNENLLPLFSKLNLTGKNIYTVLSSSDYLYMAYLFGARNVDCFDINPLTFRLFYLRKWLLRNGVIDIGASTYEEVCRILESTKPESEDESESLIFWKDMFARIGEIGFYHNPLYISIFNPFNYFYGDKTEELSRILSSINPSFHCCDIASNSAPDINGKYDYAFLSNIPDYNRDEIKMNIIVDNMVRLTNENGIVVCSHIPQIHNEKFSKVIELERKCFQREFDFSPILCDEMERIKYYQYIRKRKH